MNKRYSFEIRNKGVREYQRMINYFLIIDRIRGASYGELAKRYKLDRSNISKRVRGVLNEKARSNYNKSNSHNGSISSNNVSLEGRYIRTNALDLAIRSLKENY